MCAHFYYIAKHLQALSLTVKVTSVDLNTVVDYRIHYIIPWQKDSHLP